MGVKDFWNVASPCEMRISSHQLRGQTLAIDLAGWIVQNQTVPGMQHRVTRPHLRNLVFRANSLLSLDILPVFILDGEAPKLKAQTMEQRNLATWGPRSTSTQSQITSSPKVKKRRQFTGVLKECGKLAESLGIPFVVAPGEAEAYCAALDRAGLVDGVVSDDSDSVCYGAKTVYRNFSTDPKNFSVSKYHNKRLRKEIGISRERIVIMSLLLGCDYAPGGVCGVGKENLVRLFNLWGDPAKGELEKVLSWSERNSLPELPKTAHCGTCGHPGTVGTHRKSGCSECGTHDACTPGGSGAGCTCDYHSPENQLAITENNIRKKAIESPGWPHHEVVQEFYSLDKTTLIHTFTWTCPQPHPFIKICMTRMDWEQEYTLEKIQNLIARWQVKYPDKNSGVEVNQILKSRIQGGQNMLEIDFKSNHESLPVRFTACVPTSDFEAGFADILSTWIQEKEAKKKKPKKKKENVDPKEKPTKKKASVKPPDLVKQPSIKQFFNNKQPEALETKDDPLINIICKDINKINLQPKKLVLTTKTSKDMQKRITSAKNVTVERAADPMTPTSFSIDDCLADSFDNLSLDFMKSKKQENVKVIENSPNPNLNSSEYIEEGYNSEMSDIMNEIMGITGSSSKKPQATRLSVSTTKFHPLGHKTSTPEFRIHQGVNPEDFGSPLLGRTNKTSLKPAQSQNIAKTNLNIGQPVKTSNTKPVSNLRTIDIVKPTARVEATAKVKAAVTEDSSEDEFDNMLKQNSATPLMERVKKRLGNH